MKISSENLGILLAFATTIVWSIGIFPFTEAARRWGGKVLNHFHLLLATVLLTITCLIFNSFHFLSLFTDAAPQQWYLFGISGIIGLALGDYFSFLSFAILGTRIASLFGTLSPGAALFFGYLIIGEKLNYIGIIGMVITVAGIMWLTATKAEKAKIPNLGHGKVEKGIFWGVIAAICQGVGLVLSKKGFNYNGINGVMLSPVQVTWMRVLVATVATYLVSLFRGDIKEVMRPVITNKNKALKFVIVGTIFGSLLGISLSMYSVSLIKASVAQTIFSLVPVAVLPLGYLFYREKVTVKSSLGAFIAIIGVLILIWRDSIALFL
ncbi:MAG: DMT family transporter [Bacteroidia bacterium]